MLRRSLLSAAVAALPTTLLAQNTASTTDIVVAQIGPFTVLPAPDPKELNEGIVAALKEVNGKGGIGGRKIVLDRYDDAYSFDGFKTRLAEAMVRKPAALLAPLGSATLKALLDSQLLDQTDIVILNAVPGAKVLRNPGHPKLFHIRAGDEQQILKIVAHAQSLNIKSMGVLYQDFPMGTSGLASARAAAQKLGGISIVESKAAPDADAVRAAARLMAQLNPQSVLVIGPPKFMGDGISALREAGVSQMIFSLSYLPGKALVKYAGAGARGVGLAQTFPNPLSITLPLHRSFRAAMKAAHPALETLTAFHMEGYITGRVFIEAARRARSITPSGIADSLRQMGELDLGGYRVNFGKNNEGSDWVDIGVVTAEGRLLY